MRTFLLLLLAIAGCHHDDTKTERDRKRSTDTVTHDTPVVTGVVPAIAEPEDTTVYDVPVGSSPVLGPATARITIVEFGDFQCNFCQRAEKSLAAVRAKYGSDVRIVWKNAPMTNHKRAMPAAELAMDAADQHKDFWTMHDDLFASQSSLEDADLDRLASSHGVKRTKAHHKALDADQTLAASLGVTATPVFFVNGRKLVGAQPADAFSNLIDAELGR